MNLRPATLHDADLLYEWRVEGEQAEWYEGPQTTREQHDRWLAARLDNPAVRIWIAEIDGLLGAGAVGVVRLDSNDELSVEIDPGWRGLGYGTEAIQLACEQAEGRVKACVDGSNEAARRAFLNAGFQHREDVEFYLWRKP